MKQISRNKLGRAPQSGVSGSQSQVAKALKKYWGYDHFRPMQADIIAAICADRDVVAVLPTGAGKSLCFQLPAILRDGLTLVVSPLIALMNDQVSQLQAKGIRAAAVHSQMEWMDVQSQLNRAHHGQLDLLYVSPERLVSDRFLAQIGDTKLAGLVVDEAHCISMWGYDFRPSYMALTEIRKQFSGLQIVAMTATATPPVFKDIVEKLALEDQAVFQAPVLRENLRFGVMRPDDKMASVLKSLQQVKGPAIVYVGKRRTAHEIERMLSRRGINAAAYHAGLDTSTRSSTEEDFIRGDRRVMVATNAFGMGIDKSDVRLVLHYDIPSNLESYYQEAGRAGRDGHIGYAIALYAPSDMEAMQAQLSREFPSEKFIRKVYDSLGNFLKLAVGSGLEQTFSFDTNAFCKRYALDKIETRSAIKVLEQSEWLVLEDGTDRSSTTVHFLLDATAIYDYRMAHPESDHLINSLLRMHEGILFHPTAVDVGRVADLLNEEEDHVERRLVQLHRAGIINYAQQDGMPQLTFLRERVSVRNLTIDRRMYAFRKERRFEALSTMQAYLDSLACRQQFIAKHFGQPLASPCGQCDACRRREKAADFDEAVFKEDVLQQLSEDKKTLDQLLNGRDQSEHGFVLDILQQLVDEEMIRHEAPYFHRL